MISLVQQKLERLRTLIADANAEEFAEIIQGLLASDDAESVLAAIRLTVEMGPVMAAALVPELAQLLTSPKRVHRTSLGANAAEHLPICMAATDAILKLGVAPPAPVLAKLLNDPQPLRFEAEAYDQGAPIGDYAVDEIRPAALAAQLAILLGDDAFALAEPIVALLADGQRADDWRVTRTLNALVKAAPEKAASTTQMLRLALEQLADAPRAPAWRREHARLWLKTAGLLQA